MLHSNPAAIPQGAALLWTGCHVIGRELAVVIRNGIKPNVLPVELTSDIMGRQIMALETA